MRTLLLLTFSHTSICVSRHRSRSHTRRLHVCALEALPHSCTHHDHAHTSRMRTHEPTSPGLRQACLGASKTVSPRVRRRDVGLGLGLGLGSGLRLVRHRDVGMSRPSATKHRLRRPLWVQCAPSPVACIDRPEMRPSGQPGALRLVRARVRVSQDSLVCGDVWSGRDRSLHCGLDRTSCPSRSHAAAAPLPKRASTQASHYPSEPLPMLASLSLSCQAMAAAPARTPRAPPP